MLTPSELHAYLERIDIEEAELRDKHYLDRLIRSHQMHIPFETIGVHLYGTPDLSPEALFKKIITQKNGGYCFELNKLFQLLLESLGYRVRPVLSRAVRGRESRMPINHRGLMVDIGDESYFVDVGFGGPMPAGALLIEDGTEQDISGETYFVCKHDDDCWSIDRITQAKNDFHDGDLPARRQTELEFYTIAVEDIDFDMMNVAFSQPGTLFRDHMIVNLRKENGYKGLKDDTLTINEDGEKSVSKLSRDDELTRALHEHFGLSYDYRSPR